MPNLSPLFLSPADGATEMNLAQLVGDLKGKMHV
jgi:hypothetical protein